jgi:hypothetical protein
VPCPRTLLWTRGGRVYKRVVSGSRRQGRGEAGRKGEKTSERHCDASGLYDVDSMSSAQ